MSNSNTQLPTDPKWKLVLHEQVEDPYYETTNGPISICAPCGFVGETEEQEDAIFKKVADALNESGIDFHSENALELKQHIEIMKLQQELNDYKEVHADHKRLVREIDIALYGECAALQASLCDLVGPIRNLATKHQQLKDHYEEACRTLHRMTLSIQVHPDNQPNSEFFDLVETANESLAVWEGKGGIPAIEPVLTDDDIKAWEESKLTPEQIAERKKAIEWYRNPAGEKVAVWVKGAPKEAKQHFAKVQGMVDENKINDAVIWPLSDTEHWMCVGLGFRYSVLPDKIIAYLDESQSKESNNQALITDLETEAREHAKIITNNSEYQLYVAQGYYNGVLNERVKEGNKDREGLEWLYNDIIEFCYRHPDGRVEIRYRRIEGTPECNEMIKEVNALIEKAKPEVSPYFYRKEGEKEVKE